MSLILKDLKAKAETSAGPLPQTIVVGRPAHFVGEVRRRCGSDGAGTAARRLPPGRVPDIRFELEPVAAAYHYESGLERDELVLIADFGGGTSDFCLLRVGPEARAMADQARWQSGRRYPGRGRRRDSRRQFRQPDRRALRNAASGARDTVSVDGRADAADAGVAVRIYAALAPALLPEYDPNAADADGDLAHCGNPKQIQALITVIEEGLGFHLHRAVEQAKVVLSGSPRRSSALRCPADDRNDHPPRRLRGMGQAGNGTRSPAASMT